jgi:hypothetical protein
MAITNLTKLGISPKTILTNMWFFNQDLKPCNFQNVKNIDNGQQR